MTVSALRTPLTVRPQRQHYDHAPIVETVLEIVVESKQGNNLAQLKALGEKETEYAEKHETYEVEAAFGVGPEGATGSSGTRRLVGYQFLDRVGGRAFGARVDRFLFSKLQPYTEWERVRAEAIRLWERYAQIVKVRQIKRLGVRYVNRLDLPGPSLELKQWLLTGPEVAPGMHQQLAGFAMQIMLPQPDLPLTMATIRQAVVAPSRPDVVSLVLDIDVARSGTDVDIKKLWEEMDTLHDRENLIFECSITDRVREKIR